MKRVLLLFYLCLAATPPTVFAQIGRGAVTGQIKSPEGAPIARMRVAVLEEVPGGGAGETASLISLAETDNEGRYRLEDIPPGNYVILAGRVENATYFPGVRLQKDATMIRVAAGATLSGMNFSMTAPLKVSGRVIGENAATSGAVLLRPESGSNRAHQEPVAEDGTFEFIDVAPGNYSIAMTTQSTIVVSSKAIVGTAPGVLPISGKDVTDIVIRAASRISGHIEIKAGGPAPPMTMTFIDASGATSQTRASGPGDFFSTLAAGEYRIEMPLPDGYFVRSIRHEGRDALHAPLVIAPPQDKSIQIPGVGNATIVFQDAHTEGLRILLGVSDPPPWARVKGKVSFPEGKPRPRLEVEFWGAGVPGGRAEVNKDGTFAIGLLPGTYRIQVGGLDPDYLLTFPATEAWSREVLAERLTVNWRDTPSVDLVVGAVPPVSVSGRVVGTENLAPGNPVVVQLERIGPTSLASKITETTMRPDGSFEFPTVLPGSYRLGLPEETAAAPSVFIDATDSLRDVRLEVPRQVRIRGRVVVESGALPGRLTDMAVLAHGDVTTTGASIKPDGTFSFLSTEGELDIWVRSIPDRYELKSVTTGSIDLLQNPLQATGTVEIRIVLQRP